MLESNSQLLVSSLVDELLNELSPLNTFMRPKEYKKLYEYSKNWKSKNWFLDKFFYTPLNLSEAENKVNFDIKLYSMEKTNFLSDTIAIIPFEFQYIKRDVGYDIILLRMYLDSTSFRIATIEVTQDVYSSIQDYFQTIQKEKIDESTQNIFDLACFLCIHEYSERIFRNKGIFYDDWQTFQQEFETQTHVHIREYSTVGKYLWQIDYLCFDNRFRKGDKILTILEQLQQTMEKIEIEKKAKKKNTFSLKSMFIDEFGNYWKSEKDYLTFKKS